jgi:hypothetical protein
MRIFYAWKKKVEPSVLADYAAREKYGLLTSLLPTKEVCFVEYTDRGQKYVSFEMFDDTRPLLSIINSLRGLSFTDNNGIDYSFEDIEELLKTCNHATRLPKPRS